MEAQAPLSNPDIETMRTHAMQAGGIDPFGLRFRIVEYEKASGDLVGVPRHDLGFSDAVAATAALILENQFSHFCLEPVGFVQ